MWKVILCVALCGHVFVESANGLEDPMVIGDGCEGDVDCNEIPNAFCDLKKEKCECRSGYVPAAKNYSCLRLAAEEGGDCEIDEQCENVVASLCVNGTCVTSQENATEHECGENSHCPEGVCLNGKCSAGVPVPKLLELTLLGKPCSSDSNCSVAESVCVEKTCKCGNGSVASLNLKTCLPAAKFLGDPCSETAQCASLNGSICINQKCTEKAINFFKTPEGDSPLILGSTCNENDDCRHISNAICKEHVCECTENYITSVPGNSCLVKAAKDGDPCEIDKQCQHINGGAFCSNNKCVGLARAGSRLFNSGAPSAACVSAGALAAAGIISLKTLLI